MNNRIVAWARSSPARHGLALSTAVVALGGMILLGGMGAEARPRGSLMATALAPSVSTAGSVSFTGPGLKGTLALSQSLAQAGLNTEGPVFAEIRLQAVADEGARVRAPLSLVVAIDTSGSMGGAKIEDARRAVTRLLRDMRDDDEITIVRFASDAEVLQPSGRVGTVRESLLAKVAALQAQGGTAIPQALTSALDALGHAAPGRVRRVVLASDGIDGGRVASAALAKQAATRGLVVSSLGIGLDFDEGYLGEVAQAGGGNFGFVREGSDLAGFLKKELDEGSSTSVQSAEVTLTLPPGLRVVQAVGAEVKTDGARVTLQVGSLFAGDERRVVVELASHLADGERAQLAASAGWDHVGHGHEQASLGQVTVTGALDPSRVAASRDGGVMASVTSALASRRQMAAIEAYNRGDQATAQRLIDQNLADLDAARALAPAASASALASQRSSYESTGSGFKTAAPSSTTGKMAAKKAAASNLSNLSRSSSF